MKISKESKKNFKVVKVEKFIVKIYLHKHHFCKFKSIPLTEEQIDQFYAELNDSTSPIMEFGTFYFDKIGLDYVKLKRVIVKEKVML